jgi:hypothetical protein
MDGWVESLSRQLIGPGTQRAELKKSANRSFFCRIQWAWRIALTQAEAMIPFIQGERIVDERRENQ